MLGLETFAFAQPWLLLALVGLPALWFLLRVTPPAPKSIRFPAIRLLTGLTPPEETPQRTPLWLLLLRMLAVALLILGLAGPVLHPAGQLSGSGPLVLVIDDGWAAAGTWEERQRAMETLIDRAAREERRVILMTTARERPDEPLTASNPLRPDAALERVRAIQPKPWPSDLDAAQAVAAEIGVTGSAHVIWLSDGLAAPGTRELAATLQRLGRLSVLHAGAGRAASIVLPPENTGTDVRVTVQRPDSRGAKSVTVLAEGEDGRLVGTAPARVEAGETAATASFELPLQLRNRIARVRIEGARHAGAVALLDERWQRRPVGLVSDSPLEAAQPLLSELYYLERALKPYAEISRGTLDDLLKRDLAVLVLADRGKLSPEQREAVSRWVENGGLLLRFAGPKLAQDLSGDGITAGEGAQPPLLPVRLRRGGRALGGTMSWDTPATLAPFGDDSPFAGLEIPSDITVSRQVLAEPSLELGGKTWARLADGTPLVTAGERGDGWLVLVHTTANTSWSNLSLSGLFVRMLRRVVTVSEGLSGAADDQPALPPQRVLDGFGRLTEPGAGVRTLPAEALRDHLVSAGNPPGLYGRDGQRRAHNLGPMVAPSLAPLDDLPPGVTAGAFAMQPETRIGPWLLATALVLMLVDMLIALGLRGLLPTPRRGGAAGTTAATMLIFTACMLAWPGGAKAQGDDEFALKATLDTRLAYIETGVAEADRITRQGLTGISRVLARRSAVEPEPPLGVDLLSDEIAFFPLLYWSISPEQPDLPPAGVRKINHFLGHGGTLLIDLREAGGGSSLFGQGTPATQALRRLTRDIDIPPLTPVDPEHVLTKAFYLLQDFPGRYAGGALWVEDTATAPGDGVASVMITANDWVGAWAVDESGQPRLPVVPGGERQREIAYRVGVNVVMYALTGNYKADQVHVPAILERLGQ
ncbi:DUF4159 domain-containing protein [Ferruginivarius sediminum]|uniref:DUF4159 domain-containing protein n=1 Tax=Ferruginivarius sediminum TaxID=2661937 RepID=A0A369T9Z6_9PROT|nr:DUF4159 domain-containing protein [Ferruginivarius sediminum]RDD61672.1 DUF4159 domain-containing protein [Ferruginivarius sediminum]